VGHHKWSGWAVLGVGLWMGCGGSQAVSTGSHAVVARPSVQAQPVDPPGRPVVVVAQPAVRPKIEVVFALDTTGSMGGLIEGAKQKIWAIADELASAQPRPELRVGLVAYRDRGDQYVTQHFPLTDDLDVVYQQLHALRAEGGGDGPESVNQALYEAVRQTAWSTNEQVYRTVFLVGDAPPHQDYPDDVSYVQTVQEAKQKGIVLNTVQCGSESETQRIWLAIAQTAQGSYAAIEQSGGMQQIAAPMDPEIEALNARLSGTVLPYGRREQQEKVRAKAQLAGAAPASASAARLSYLDKQGGELVTGGGDLVDDVKAGRVDLAAMKDQELPAQLRGLSSSAQAAELERMSGERVQLKRRLDELVKARASFVREVEARQSAEGKPDGFDQEVMRAVKEQAKRAGIGY
jgi:Mg-chelatase subunit ChlD